ncbi:unnamed protein product [Ceutorhynchus assimilis]|uniref:Pleckstrin homology domain-containing family G member 1 n=1 Tax=Ceutorhynchus assimilis TaxID=467358 RepID=A0A9P0DKD1_9CUCU|nr:unnamed protein product [Ceutorhynchus assimilis]
MSDKDGVQDPKGSSPDLMPSIMGAFDAYLNRDSETSFKTSTPKRTHQFSNFTHLSPCVQKILSNVPEQEVNKKFYSEETLSTRRNRYGYRSLRTTTDNKSQENLDYNISPGVHKMISNLQDSELVIKNRNHSYLFPRGSNGISDKKSDICDLSDNVVNSEGYVPVPLGSYLHSDKGIASRTPVGRKNMGKYLQIPSESSTGGITNSTASSSEVSRPVSLTSLGSCSSSGSSNGHLHHHQPESAYLASAESLDSDPEPGGIRQGSADSGIAEQEQPSINPEQRVLQEVLDTETVYVADLQEVIQGYLEQWRSDPDCPLTEYLPDLFTNLEEICEFSRKILEDLRISNLDPTKTANVFLQHDGGFKVYNAYCARYPRTMEVLGVLQRDQIIAPLIREKQMQLGHALPLGSYLLKPVQRILKYHLLLQRLSKQCEPQHKPTVDLALATMTAVASDINNMKRKHEHSVRVQEIQSQLYGWTGADLTTLGELIVEGTFRVQGAKGRRHVFLFEKVLLLAKSRTEGALAYKTHIECSNLMLVEQVRGDVLSFQVLPFDNPRLQCTLRARSVHYKREWTMQIKRAILENYSAVIPNHARQLVMQLGQDVTETDDTSEKWLPLKHNSTTPHYLEKRTRVRKTRGDFSKDRSISQDRTFTSFGSWRRKSEPMIPQQYDNKIVTTKISKLKKTKENGSSTFYTDLSDSETCELASESVESLDVTRPEQDHQKNDDISPKTIEKIVSELLMQNQEFHKVFNRGSNNQHQNQSQRHPRRNVTSEPGPIWYDESRLLTQLPSKADSLPRSFQLNDPGLQGEGDVKKRTAGEFDETQRENEMSSRLLDDTQANPHPEYKIYRKTPLRLSMLQRLRMILSEEQRRKHPVQTQPKGWNKSTGEKLANPDYVDPQTLFVSNGHVTSNQVNGSNNEQDLMGERVELDMTLNPEVLKEFDLRLKRDSNTSHQSINSSHQSVNSSHLQLNSPHHSPHSSHHSPSDSYYESILETSLTEEYVKDSVTGKLVVKSDSFTDSHRSQAAKPIIVKRPTNAPPPIPVKPLRLTKLQACHINSCNSKPMDNKGGVNGGQTSWVRAMVGRFE